MTFVVDASLATKWLIEENDSALADALLARWFDRLHAPDLFLIEVARAIVRRCNERVITSDTAQETLGDFRWRILPGIALHRVTPPLMAEGARLAIDLGHPLQDCIYLALADELGVPLVTSDVKFHDRVGDPARVRLLADLG